MPSPASERKKTIEFKEMLFVSPLPAMLIITKQNKSHGTVTFLLENTTGAKAQESHLCIEQLTQ